MVCARCLKQSCCNCVTRQGFAVLEQDMAIGMELERPWKKIGFPKN